MESIAIKKLKELGVDIRDISQITYDIQIKYSPNITLEKCDQIIVEILSKREVINTILTGIAIDKAAEDYLLDDTINRIILEDNPLYGLDEVLALSIVNLYGSIALTNFGYLDKTKAGIIKEIDDAGKLTERCTTFLDDLICAIAASAAAELAHNKKES